MAGIEFGGSYPKKATPVMADRVWGWDSVGNVSRGFEFKDVFNAAGISFARITNIQIGITSDTAGTITATWYNANNQQFTVTAQALVFAGTPGTGDFRWDLIELLSNGTVNVNTGTEGTSAVRPTPTSGALIASEIVWDDAGTFEVEIPEKTFSSDRYSSIIEPNTTNKFTKIWEGDLVKGKQHAICLQYSGNSSDWIDQGKGHSGQVNFNFLVNNSREIVSTSYQIEAFDTNGLQGDFTLVGFTGGTAAIYYKSRAFWGRIHFRSVFFNDAINGNDFIDNATYIASIPANIGTYESVPVLSQSVIKASAFPEAEERASNTVLFDKNYIIGNAGARSGNILFDFTNAKLGATTMMIHNDGSAFTIPGEKFEISGEYVPSVDNYIWMVLVKKSSPQVVQITFSQEIV